MAFCVSSKHRVKILDRFRELDHVGLLFGSLLQQRLDLIDASTFVINKRTTQHRGIFYCRRMDLWGFDIRPHDTEVEIGDVHCRGSRRDQLRKLCGSNFVQAFDIISRLGCQQVYIYAMGQEPWLNHIMCLRYSDTSPQIVESNKLLEACQKRGIVSERLYGYRELYL